MDWIKKNWCYLIIGIFIIPIVLNFILLIPSKIAIVGNATDWLRFWAAYLGIIIAIIVPSTVCYYSLKENRISRKEIIKKESIYTLRKICLSCVYFYNLKIISEKIAHALSLLDLEICIKEHCKEIEKTHLEFILNFDKKHRNALELLTLELKCYKFQNDFLSDVFFLIQAFKYFKEKEIFKGFVLNHKFKKNIPNIAEYIDNHFKKLDIFIVLLIGELIVQYANTDEKTAINKFIECIEETFDMNNIYLDSLKYGTEQDK